MNTRLTIRAACLLPALLCMSGLLAQNRAGFLYKLKQRRVDNATWSIQWVPEETKPPAQPSDPIPYQVCTKKIKTLLGPAGEQIPLDVWSFTNAPKLTSTKTSDLCIDASTAVNSTKAGLRLVHPKRKQLGDPIKNLWLGYTGWAFGASAVAARVRFAVDDLNETGVSGFNFALYGGRMWGQALITPRRITHFGVIVGPFLGASTTELKQAVYKNKELWKSDRTALTMTYGGNVIITRNVLGLVLSYGYETVLGPRSAQWVYNWNPWFGIGVATNLGTF